MPTGMERLTSNQWALGPSAFGLMMPGYWILGLLVLKDGGFKKPHLDIMPEDAIEGPETSHNRDPE